MTSIATEAALAKCLEHDIPNRKMAGLLRLQESGCSLLEFPQVIQPQFTSEEIFGMHDRGSFAIVREQGFANLSMGLPGMCSLIRIRWIVPTSLVGGAR